LHYDFVTTKTKQNPLMSEKSIPDDLKKEIAAIVQRFNQEIQNEHPVQYLTRYRGKNLYLDRIDFGSPPTQSICRLTYTGNIDTWDFAIYKYSNERYDPEDWLIPGIECVDGTIEGAMRAGLEAYPP
jgi:hypothetical protein